MRFIVTLLVSVFATPSFAISDAESARALQNGKAKMSMGLEKMISDAISTGKNVEAIAITGFLKTSRPMTEAEVLGLFMNTNSVIRTKISDQIWTFQASLWGVLVASNSQDVVSIQASQALQRF